MSTPRRSDSFAARTTLLVALAASLTAVSFCACLSVSQTIQSNTTQAPSPKSDSVSYKGISFTFDRSLAQEVKTEIRPEVTDGKPCDIVPEHPAFTLVGYPRSPSMPEDDPQIRILDLAKFRQAMSVASEANRKSVVYPKNPPNWTAYLDEEVRVLRALLDKQPKLHELKSFLTKVRSPESRQFTNFPQMPFLPLWEASQAFVAKPVYLRFKNGRGVFFLTQWNTETSQAVNEGLEYAFQGITDDGKNHVYAEFSVRAPFLPSENDPAVTKWDEKNYLLPQDSKTYQEYIRPIVDRLQATPSEQFQPDLRLLEKLMMSLYVTKSNG